MVFLMEGLPAVILGFVVLAYLSDGPKSASWLTEEERALIAGRLERDPTRDQGHGSLRQAVANPALWLLCFVYFTLNVGGYGVNLWQPQIIQGFGKLTPIQLGFLNAIPSLIGGIAMVLIGMSSDRHGERRLHVAGTLAVASLGLALCAFQTQPIFGLASLSLASIGLLGFLGPFWAMPTSLLRGTAAAAGIAFINSVGNLGGYVGPSVVGAISDKTHDFKLGLLTLSSVLIIGAVTALFLNRKER